jgi:hypothetical protein
VADSCKHGSESSGSWKDGEFLDYVSECYLLKKALLHGVR